MVIKITQMYIKKTMFKVKDGQKILVRHSNSSTENKPTTPWLKTKRKSTQNTKNGKTIRTPHEPVDDHRFCERVKQRENVIKINSS